MSWKSIARTSHMLIHIQSCTHTHCALNYSTYLRFSFGLARFPSVILSGNSLLIDVWDLLSMKHIVCLSSVVCFCSTHFFVMTTLKRRKLASFHYIKRILFSFLFTRYQFFLVWSVSFPLWFNSYFTFIFWFRLTLRRSFIHCPASISSSLIYSAN